MRRLSPAIIIASVALFFSLAGSASAATTQQGNPRLVAVVAKWAARQGGSVTYARAWSVNRHREVVTVQFPLTFEPSGLVGGETMTILAWHCARWEIAYGFAPVSTRTIGSSITYPTGMTPTSAPTQVN